MKTKNRVMVQCRTMVKRDAVRRETIDGVEHIIVSSSTLPDDVVMNGGLYPADEIANSYESLELTLAPVEHPEIDGQFISANDPRAIHAFHAGAFNMNVRREGGRVLIDKYINVAEAMKSDRGKRLLDRIEELETNESARPIHTSVGVFLSPEVLDSPVTNAAGDEYSWIARDMVFDHDAILLDSVGAAQPHQGVGVAVNKQGDECEVHSCSLDKAPEKFDRLATLFGNQSFQDIRDAVVDALDKAAIMSDYIEELFTDSVVFWSRDQLFNVPFALAEDGTATIVGIPLPVERTVTFTPKTNHSEGEAMKELILNALKAAGIETEGKSDGELFAAYNQLQATQSDGNDSAAAGDNDGLAEIVANALKPLSDEIAALKNQQAASANAELDRLAGVVANSGKYPALDAESAKLLGVDKLKELAANCSKGFGVSPVFNSRGGADEQSQAPADMPN